MESRWGRVASPDFAKASSRRAEATGLLPWGQKSKGTNADGPLGDRTLPPPNHSVISYCLRIITGAAS